MKEFYDLLNKENIKIKVTPNKKDIIIIIDRIVITNVDIDTILGMISDAEVIYFILKKNVAKEYDLKRVKIDELVEVLNTAVLRHLSAGESKIVNDIKSIILDYIKSGNYMVYSL